MKKSESRNSYAVAALEETHDYLEAAKLLKEWAEKDPAIWHSVTEPLLEKACYEAVRATAHTQRSEIWNAPANHDPSGRGDRLLAFANSYLDFPLPGGKLLRDARASDLKEAIEFYSKQAKNMQHKADWLQAILNGIGNKKVATVFTDEKLEELKEKVQK